jgi:cephalosporin hydroxylase
MTDTRNVSPASNLAAPYHTDPREQFRSEGRAEIDAMARDHDVQALSRIWVREIARYKYAYHFEWLGRPIIQFPQDVVAIQEILWNTKPDLVIETGIAHGGSLILHASILEMIGHGEVIGIDIDIRAHNRVEIESHRLAHRIGLIQGSSTDPATAAEVHRRANDAATVVLILDSNHTHDHVLDELRLYSDLVRSGGWIIVMDTLIEDVPDEYSADRSWGVGNNPKTAVRAFLQENARFESDTSIDAKLLISASPEGYLRCTRN